MSLRFVDSFDHYNTAQVTRKWNVLGGTTSILAGGGRNGTQSLHIPSQNCYLLKTIDPQPSWVVGFAANFSRFGLPGSGQGLFFQFLDVGSPQLDLVHNPDGTLSVQRNGVAEKLMRFLRLLKLENERLQLEIDQAGQIARASADQLQCTIG